jgi:putative membrane protein
MSGGIPVRGFIVGTVITAVAFWVLITFLPQFVTYKGETVGLLGLAVIFGVVNGLIGPILKIMSFPLTLVTMGLIGFVVNAALLLVTALVANSTGFDLTVGDFPPDITADTILAAFVGSIVLSLVGTAARLVVPD